MINENDNIYHQTINTWLRERDAILANSTSLNEWKTCLQAWRELPGAYPKVLTVPKLKLYLLNSITCIWQDNTTPYPWYFHWTYPSFLKIWDTAEILCACVMTPHLWPDWRQITRETRVKGTIRNTQPLAMSISIALQYTKCKRWHKDDIVFVCNSEWCI